MKRVSIFLIALALIVGVTGCGPAPLQHALTISSSVGGNVITPGEGTFTIDYGTVVGLVAEPDDNFHFVQWTGDVGTVADAGAAFTTITIEGDYTITAQFGIDLQELIEYELTISSTAGGSVTVPGEGVLEYEEETVVDLVAVADDCYEFVGWTGDVEDIDDPLSATTTITVNDNCSITANFEFKVDPMIAAGGYHTVGLKSNGTVVAAGSNASGQCDVDDWEDIIQVTAGVYHTVGLKDDGAVAAAGSNDAGQCDVGDWEGMFQVAAGEQQEVGGDGGDVFWQDAHERLADRPADAHADGQRDGAGWTDILQVAPGEDHTVGLKDDGTVVAVGDNDHYQCDVDDWNLN